MKDSEYYVQIFLFVATILCYIVLAVFIFYGVYYCCVRACILRTKKKRQEDNVEQQGEDAENLYNRYCGRVTLLYPFQKDDKNAIIALNSNTSKNIPTTTEYKFGTEDNNISDNVVISNSLDERNPFVDKKYYDIFVA